MSWIDDVTAALMGAMPPPKAEVFVGTITTVNNRLCVSWRGGDPQPATWSSSFDLVRTARGLSGVEGLKVLVLLPDGQPFISDLIITGG